MPSNETDKRYAIIEAAFKADGFTITKKAFTVAGRLGLEAQHETSKNYDTGQKKKSYYMEGTPYERGFLLGLLAEPEIYDTALNFTGNILSAFFGPELLTRSPAVWSFFIYAINELSHRTWPSLPRHIHDEVSGMLYGCSMANRSTKVTEDALIKLNTGLDALCALIYTGKLKEVIPQLTPEIIQLPILCNAVSMFSGAAQGEHFFGHDFTFTSKSLFQNNIAHIITSPIGSSEESGYPFVCVTAPGILGGISAMNTEGIAGGLNMSAAANCSEDDLGLNSFLLLRECIMQGGSASQAAYIIQNAKRGVPWNYVLSDGKNDAACTAEAGVSGDNINFLSYPDKKLLARLPDEQFLSSNVFSSLRNGCAVRRCGSAFSDSYLKFNDGLWEDYNDSHDKKIELHDDAFEPGGSINRTPDEKNCPGSLYFAPQRTGVGVHITTNSFLLPQMRLCAMRPWIDSIVSKYANDMQWRYDELNHQVRDVCESGGIDYESAKRVIDFLAPNGKFPMYYAKKPKNRYGSEARIEGCTTLFDLKKKTTESHYGCYCDDWVKTTLPAYFASEPVLLEDSDSPALLEDSQQKSLESPKNPTLLKDAENSKLLENPDKKDL